MPDINSPPARWRLLAMSLLLLLLSAVAVYRLSAWQWQSLLTEQAQHDLYQAVHNSPRHWDFTGTSLITSTFHHLIETREANGSFAFTTSGSDPYFALNLHHRSITARYTQLAMDINSSEATTLQLFFTADNNEVIIYGSAPVPITAGKQTVHIALDNMQWTATEQHRNAAGFRATPVWGGANGIVDLLRIDPANKAGIHMQISDITLAAPTPLVAAGDALQASSVIPFRKDTAVPTFLADIATKNRKRDRIIVSMPDIFFSQQQAKALYREITTVAPEAIIFPATVSGIFKNGAPQMRKEEPAWPLFALRNVAYGMSAAMVVLLLFLLCTHRGVTTVTRKAMAMELTGVLALLYCMWWLVCHNGNGWLLLVAPAFFLTCRHLLTQQAGSLRERLGLQKPDTSAWRDTLWSSLLIVALWSASFIVSKRTPPVAVGSLVFSLVFYPLWALVQQFLMGPLLAATVSRLAHDKPQHYPLCAVAVALVFSLLHYPNDALMLMTLLTGSMWAWLYLRHRTIIPLAIAHGVLGSLYFQLSPDLLLPDGNVGPAYFDWLLLRNFSSTLFTATTF